ncbi:methyltransferase domain-containing protein [Sphingobacterium deserti]|uniref:Methyltransferase type 11 domain-containing protein n=1 Tax=Sphingobacterium deserti TaxID=1229276 RepID=A0A0B8SYR2_9SPHI|nr:methyltransferase domain-containing protein [Sphingobacterium deserti]KGE12281.1 hypothetical protein DI53_3931 [Sphingobacterium deserti]
MKSKIETEFGKVADHYSAYRPFYPQELFTEIFRSIPSQSFDIAIDVGAGTGLSTIPLCEKFKTVYAVEPDAHMANVLRKNLTQCCPNTKVYNDLLESITDFKSQRIDLVSFGTSFYWADGNSIIKKVKEILDSDGLLAVYRYDFPIVPVKIRDFINTELSDKWDSFRHERLRDTSYSYRTITESDAFSNVRLSRIENNVVLSVDELVGFFTSTSFVSNYLKSLNDPKAYVQNFKEELYRRIGMTDMDIDFGIELIRAHNGPKNTR